jgi:hypothetical protein
MKKTTQIIIATIVALVATALIVVKNEPATHTQAIAEKKARFNTLQISDGITVEFEYGTQLQVFVEGKNELIRQIVLVLENSILKAAGRNDLVTIQDIRIKVVTPVLISLATTPKHTPASCKNQNGICLAPGKEVYIKPSLCRQKVFQVFTPNV